MTVFQKLTLGGRRLSLSIFMGGTAAFLLLFVLYTTASAVLIGSGAGGCGDFDDALAKVQDGGTVLQMLPAKETFGAVITRDVRLSGGWAPTVNCDEANQRFTTTQDYIQYGFVYSAPQQLSELNNANDPVLVFDLNDKRVVIENMLIRNNGLGGNGAGFSGTVDNNSDVFLKNVAFRDSESEQNGTGIYWTIDDDSHVLMKDVVFSNNTATGLGAGLYLNITDNSSVTIDGAEFSQNQGDSGGFEIYVDSTSELIIKNGLFAENGAAADGGGGRIFVNGGRVTILDSVFRNNQAGENGAGLYVQFDGGEMSLQNVTFDGNEADSLGGAIYAESVGVGSAVLDLINVQYVNSDVAPVHSATSGSGALMINSLDEQLYLPLGVSGTTLGAERVWITNVTLSTNFTYLVEFEANFDPDTTGVHVHFFFDDVAPQNAGVPGSGPWVLYGGDSPFSQSTFFDRMFGSFAAEQMCVLVADADHSVRQGTGNCMPLP